MEVILSDIQTPSGSDYNPTTDGKDLYASIRGRLSDHYNCAPYPCSGPYDQPATTSDKDFSDGLFGSEQGAGTDIDCVPNGDPLVAPGSSCNLNTSWNAVLPGSFVAGKSTVLQFFRLRVHDINSGIFAQQGIYIP